MKSWPLSAKLVVFALALLASISLVANVRLMSEQSAQPISLLPEDMLTLAHEHFPKEFAAVGNPEDLAMIFVINESRQAVAKALAKVTIAEPALATIQKAFPASNLSKLRASGTMCFAEEPGKHGKFCVLWAMPAG